MSLIIVTTTSDDRDELEVIARQLVEAKLAACCQIAGPISSVYTWQGNIESSIEWSCAIKTQTHLFAKVEAKIQELHHYDVPQILAVEVSHASERYRKWVGDQTAN